MVVNLASLGIGNALAIPFPAAEVMHEGEGRTYEVSVDAADTADEINDPNNSRTGQCRCGF